MKIKNTVKLLLLVVLISLLVVAAILVLAVGVYEKNLPVASDTESDMLPFPTTPPETTIGKDPSTDTSATPTTPIETETPPTSPGETTVLTTPEETTVTPTTPIVTTPEETTSRLPDTSKKLVALTFDDGPHGQYTDELLDVLDKYNVKATFFVIGAHILRTNAINALKRAASSGHEIGNHTYSHSNVLNMSVTDFRNEILGTSEIIYNHTGVTPTLLRTTGGQWSSDLLASVDLPFINWTVDTKDWSHNDPNQSLEILKSSVTDGGIVLLHDRKSNVAATAELFIQWLNENGYEIVTVSELLKAKGVEIEAGKVYYSSYRVRP